MLVGKNNFRDWSSCLLGRVSQVKLTRTAQLSLVHIQSPQENFRST